VVEVQLLWAILWAISNFPIALHQNLHVGKISDESTYTPAKFAEIEHLDSPIGPKLRLTHELFGF